MKNFVIRMLFVIPLFFIACNKSEDIELDFEISFPDDWIQYIYAEEGRVMDASRAAKNEADSLPESLVIFRTSFPSSTLALYYGTLKPSIIASEAHDSIVYESDTVVNEINMKKMQSHEQLRFVNTFTQDTTFAGVITERYFIYRNDFGYNLTFIAADTAYNESREIFGDILNSFRFKQ